MQRRSHHLRIRGIRSQGSKEVKESHIIRFYLQSNDGNNAMTIRNDAKHLRHNIGITFLLFPSDEANERSFSVQINELNFTQKVLLTDLPGFWDPTADGKEFFHRFQQDSISIIVVLAWNFKQDPVDPTLRDYSAEFVKKFRQGAGEPYCFKPQICFEHVWHRFLGPVDESKFALTALKKKFEDLPNLAVFVRVGKFSTQVYRGDQTIGAYFVGSYDMMQSPVIISDQIVPQMLDSIRISPDSLLRAVHTAISAADEADAVTEMRDKRKIIFVIDDWHFNGSSAVDITTAISDAMGEQLHEVIHNRDLDLVKLMSDGLGELHPDGFYMADFGETEIKLSFHRAGLSPRARTEATDLGSVRLDDEANFIAEMIDGRFYSSRVFEEVVTGLHSMIADHATRNGISSGEICFEIFQRGLASRQHFLSTTRPSLRNQVDLSLKDVCLKQYAEEFKRRVQSFLSPRLTSAPIAAESSEDVSAAAKEDPKVAAKSFTLNAEAKEFRPNFPNPTAPLGMFEALAGSGCDDAILSNPAIRVLPSPSRQQQLQPLLTPEAVSAGPTPPSTQLITQCYHTFLGLRNEAELERNSVFRFENIDANIKIFVDRFPRCDTTPVTRVAPPSASPPLSSSSAGGGPSSSFSAFGNFFRRRMVSGPSKVVASIETPSSPSREKMNHVAVMVSIGKDSCRVFTKESTIGAFYVGTEAMQRDPRVAKKMMRDIIEEVQHRCIDAPMILIDCIGSFVKLSVRLDLSSTLERDIEDALKPEMSELNKEVLLAISAACREKDWTASCIVKAEEDEAEIRGGWFDSLCERLVTKKQGTYVVDFGADRLQIYYNQPGKPAGETSDDGRSARSSMDSTRSMLPSTPISDGSPARAQLVFKDQNILGEQGQAQFVSKMMRGEYDGSDVSPKGFCHTVSLLGGEISKHARQYGVSPVVCRVYQTGLARQQHFQASITQEEIPQMRIFTDDTNLLRYSRMLSHMLAADSTGIEAEHLFLSPSDEAEMERQAVFELADHYKNKKNQDGTFGEKIETNNQDINSETIKILRALQGDVFDKTDKPDLAIIVSMRTGSTQVFTANEVIGTFFLGTEVMKKDPDIADEPEKPSIARRVLDQIVSASEHRSLVLPIILTGSISHFVSESVLLREDTDVEKIVKSEGDKIKDKIKAAILAAFQKVAVSNPSYCVIIRAKDQNMASDWVDVKACKLLREHPNGCYVVDFGGGGPDIRFCKMEDEKMCIELFAAPNRGILGCQEEFVDQMKRCQYQVSPLFDSVVTYLRNEILAHARQHELQTPIICKIFQTGFARQQYMKGMLDLRRLQLIDEPEGNAPRTIRIQVKDFYDDSRTFGEWHSFKAYLRRFGSNERKDECTRTDRDKRSREELLEFKLVAPDFRHWCLCLKVKHIWLNTNKVGSIPPINLEDFMLCNPTLSASARYPLELDKQERGWIELNITLVSR